MRRQARRHARASRGPRGWRDEARTIPAAVWRRIKHRSPDASLAEANQAEPVAPQLPLDSEVSPFARWKPVRPRLACALLRARLSSPSVQPRSRLLCGTAMAYVPLPIVDVKVADLHLDLSNYRIPSRPDDEAAALTYLFASEDVMEAALLILRDGYFDNEVPIVIEDGRGGHVVLEGNRRVGALKALRNPAIALSHAPELERLLKKYATEAQDLPHKIRVLVAPDLIAGGLAS